MQDTESFWYLGGNDFPDETAVTDTIYFNTSAQIHRKEGLPMSKGRQSHCALNVKMDFAPFNKSQNQVWVIGGVNALQTVETYCQKQTGVNEAICSHDQDGLHWSSVTNLNKDRDGHTCTAFRHKQHGLAILVAYGHSSLEAEIFLIEECSNCIDPDCVFKCSWQLELDGIGLEGQSPKRYDSKMVTLNGVPTIFGGASTETNEELNQVIMFRDVSPSDDSKINYWELVSHTVSSRQRHTVVSVPLSFICAEDAVTTSTTR